MNHTPWQRVPAESQFRSTDLPQSLWWGGFIRFVKTFEVCLFKLLQVVGLYRPQKSLLGLPSIATSNFTIVQAVIYNGTQEEVLGFKPRRFFYRLLKGIPDVELFERVRFELAMTPNHTQAIEGSSETRGFIHLQFPSQLPWNAPPSAWLRMKPRGVETLLGRITLGDYEVISSPVFFLTPKTKWIIVTDIDDTIKDSNIAETTTLKSVLTGIVKGHYYTYKPIPGMAELYQSWVEKGAMLVYLTSTPYQLAPFLLKFLRQCKFPEGPVFLRWLGYGRVRHKWRTLLKLITTLEPDQKVILVGDSGEKDLHIYRRICENPVFSSHVAKILIRHVAGTPLQKPLSEKEAFYSEISELKDELKSVMEPPKP